MNKCKIPIEYHEKMPLWPPICPLRAYRNYRTGHRPFGAAALHSLHFFSLSLQAGHPVPLTMCGSCFFLFFFFLHHCFCTNVWLAFFSTAHPHATLAALYPALFCLKSRPKFSLVYWRQGFFYLYLFHTCRSRYQFHDLIVPCSLKSRHFCILVSILIVVGTEFWIIYFFIEKRQLSTSSL